MNFKRNILVSMLSLVPVFGLISCSKDKPVQTVDYDMWEDAPIITVVQNTGESSRTQIAGDTKNVSSNDRLQLSDPKSQAPKTEGVVSVSSQVSCQNAGGQSFELESVLPTQETYKILDLLPLDVLPSQIENLGRSSDVLCNFSLLLANKHGSTRNRKIQNILVHFDFSETKIQIRHAKGSSQESLLTLSNEESFQAYLNGIQSAGSTYILSCTDFQTRESYSSSLKLADLSINQNVLINEIDPRRAFPRQVCRLYQRLTTSETQMSAEFHLEYPVYSLELRTTIAINEIWSGSYMTRLNVVRSVVTNPYNYPVQIRVRKSVGSVAMAVVSGAFSPFVTHNRFVRTLNLNIESNQVFEHADFQYVTVGPQTSMQIVYSIEVGLGCAHESSVMGMDYSFSNEELLTIDQIQRPLGLSNVNEQQFTSHYSMTVNAQRASGPGREAYYVPWNQSQYSKEILFGSPVQTGQPCWN